MPAPERRIFSEGAKVGSVGDSGGDYSFGGIRDREDERGLEGLEQPWLVCARFLSRRMSGSDPQLHHHGFVVRKAVAQHPVIEDPDGGIGKYVVDSEERKKGSKGEPESVTASFEAVLQVFRNAVVDAAKSG